MRDHKECVAWNRHFLDWLLHSDFGIAESRKLNNHGSFCCLMRAVIALYIGDRTVAIQGIEEMRDRISKVIRTDGTQPLELARTRTWHYSCFNLTAFTRMAEVSERLGIDLWAYRGPEGQSLHAAVDYLIPAATGTSP